MNDFPKMLYKAGTRILFEGVKLDTLTVADAKEEASARKSGWADLNEAMDQKTNAASQK